MKKYLLLPFVLFIAGFYYLADVFIEDENFRVMEPEQVYRAAQISQDNWPKIYHKVAFKSVLNLRGANPDQEWYKDEMAFAATHGIQHVDMALSARKEPDMPTMEHLVETMRQAPKPLLIHCKQGADRSGLASALYAYAVLGRPAQKAADQLSIRYGHFPWLTSETGAMDKAFTAYVQAHPQPGRQ